MMLVTAIVKPLAIADVQDALYAVGVTGITVSAGSGVGRQRGHTETYGDAEYKVDFVAKLRVDVVVADDAVEEVVRVVTCAARTGKIGDGKVWVTAVSPVVRFHSEEQDAELGAGVANELTR